MWSALVFSVILCGVLVFGDEQVKRIVKTSQGPVQGYKNAKENIFTFYEIPYATAPTGENRFKAPLPAPTWLTPLEAVQKKIVCPQFQMPMMPHDLFIQEDCLVANVFVPDTEETNLPVVVYVHGGAFQIGFGELITSKKLVSSKQIVLVTFNYRLGIHGFLCLGTEDAPGNAGIKDQVALLRWVKKNIASFGGNPNDVTVAGYSAGSASVDLLMLSPSTKGLFNKVIPESGANLAAFAVQVDPIATAREFARRFNNTDSDVYALEKFFKSASFETLTSDPFMERKDSTFSFSPCVERKTKEETFLEDSPFNILITGNYEKVPILYGFANMEGLLRIEQFQTWKEAMNEKFSDFLPPDLQFTSEEEKEKVASQIKEFYFGDKKVSDDSVLEYVNYFSDVLFTYSTLRAVKLHAEAGNDKIYLYEYSFYDGNTPPVPHTNNVQGSNHCSQTAAVFDGIPFFSAEEDGFTEEFVNMKKIMRELWLNFIKTGVPVPEGTSLSSWPPAGGDGSPYMSLGRTIELRDSALLEKRRRMWDDVYAKHYRAPMPPPTPLRHTEL